MIWPPVLFAISVSFWAGGTKFPRRIRLGGLCGALIGFFYALINSGSNVIFGPGTEQIFSAQILGQIATSALWKMFLFTLLAVLAVLIFEARPLRKNS
jgi:hypothetical protein